MKYLFTAIFIPLMFACQPTADTSPAAETAPDAPLPIKVVVVTMFEPGSDMGDQPGELQLWAERFPFADTLALPQAYHHLRYNAEQGVLAMVTGVGSIRSAASVMALGMDPRFDLTKAYWVVAGIAGVDPEDAPTGAAVWAEWLVDGDLNHEIDAREIPDDWDTGIFPIDQTEPYQEPVPTTDGGEVFRLNTQLVDWAYQLTKDIALEDTEELQQMRARFVNYPKAQEPPRVMKGDHVAAMTFWHGEKMNEWANRWVKYWTDGQGEFVTSAMEDTGTAQALHFLDAAGRVDADRLLVLRTASNFSMPYRGLSAAQSMLNENQAYSAYVPSLEAAYWVGSTVVNALIEGWPRYEAQLPE
ncbi:MAG: purine nucleoside permease [Tunicatimonas sp.]